MHRDIHIHIPTATLSSPPVLCMDSFLTYLVSITETHLQYSMSIQMKHFNTLDGSFLLADKMA